MRAAAILLLCTGCEVIFGIGDTKLQPDAPPRPIVDVGNGRDGALIVGTTSFTDEVRTNLAEAVGANSTLIKLVSTAGLSVGDEVLVIQMTGTDGGNSDAGRIISMTGSSITLDRPLGHSYMPDADNVVQVIEIPNYTDVTVPTGTRLTAHPFDGALGGVLFFRASGVVRIQDGGLIDAPGGQGGAPGLNAEPTVGGFGGGGGGRVNCPLACSANTLAADGGNAQFGFGMAGGPGAVNNMCKAGKGGFGGLAALDPGDPMPATRGLGPGGATVGSGGGKYASADSSHPLIGGGGAGGDGVKGGRGAAGGGGGGGAVSSNPGSGGNNGQQGEPGGAGGNSGAGGNGGGIVWIHASEIQLDGTISVNGSDGGAPSNGLDGGVGGEGGNGGDGGFPLCHNAQINGGKGGGGAGANGGDGGNGGGGGAGGTMIIEVFTMKRGGALTGRGGTGTVSSLGGQPGAGGMGPVAIGQAASGAAGANGVGGVGGDAGRLYIFWVEQCTSCDGSGDPAATVMKR